MDKYMYLKQQQQLKKTLGWKSMSHLSIYTIQVVHTVCRPNGSECQVVIGKFASGGILVDNAVFMENLLASPDFKDVVGGDMEAWGFYNAVKAASVSETGIEWIVVKGISDWGSGKTSGWQPLAATAAADLVYTVLRAPDALPIDEVGLQCNLTQCFTDNVLSQIALMASQ